MSTTTSSTSPTRAGLDLAPTTSDRLPLWLALFAVPGVTVMWDVLPAGGFYTGVPAAIAAIVLARRARSESGASRTGTAAIVIAGLCLLTVAACMAIGGS